MKVYFVGAGPGDPELLTVKARRLLEQARLCIYAGSLIAPDILKLLPPQAERNDSARLDLSQIIALFQRAAQENIDVVRLHTGEPAIYGAIGEQMDALDRLAIDYEVVPGISAFQAAAATLRVELTAPEVAQTVILTRTPGRTPMPPAEDLARLAPSRATLCLFLSTGKVAELAAMLAEHYGAECPAAMVYHASWPDEIVIRGTLADVGAKVAAAGIQRTALFLVGYALARPAGSVSKLYAPSFSHGYRSAGDCPNFRVSENGTVPFDPAGRGKLYVVGIGPGGKSHRTLRAIEAIAESRVVVGYAPYLEAIADLTAGKELIVSGMTHEVVRCREALQRAAAGETVALISSGDPGIYGMAGLAFELAQAEALHVPIEIVPGVTAASAAAAALGAPLMLDFAVISLSDLLVSWETVRTRLQAVAAADLVTVLYNPRSRTRRRQLDEAVEIFRAVRPGSTPVGVATSAGQVEEALAVTDLDHVLQQEVGMRSVVVIGNRSTQVVDGHLVTARGYRL